MSKSSKSGAVASTIASATRSMHSVSAAIIPVRPFPTLAQKAPKAARRDRAEGEEVEGTAGGYSPGGRYSPNRGTIFPLLRPSSGPAEKYFLGRNGLQEAVRSSVRGD